MRSPARSHLGLLALGIALVVLPALTTSTVVHRALRGALPSSALPNAFLEETAHCDQAHQDGCKPSQKFTMQELPPASQPAAPQPVGPDSAPKPSTAFSHNPNITGPYCDEDNLDEDVPSIPPSKPLSKGSDSPQAPQQQTPVPGPLSAAKVNSRKPLDLTETVLKQLEPKKDTPMPTVASPSPSPSPSDDPQNPQNPQSPNAEKECGCDDDLVNQLAAATEMAKNAAKKAKEALQEAQRQ